MRNNPKHLPLYDHNGEQLRFVTPREAQRLVSSEQAHAVVPGNWRNRPDVEWQGVQLIIPQRNNESPASISAAEMRVNAGACSAHHSPAYVESVRAKVEAWPFVGDTFAVAVRPRV
jgi:hypothetical protein